MGGGSKKQTVGYKYYVGLHLVLGLGVIDKVIRVRVAEKTVFEGYDGSPTITIDKPDIFGGESREGGVSGTLSVFNGSPTQQRSSYLRDKIGELIPAFRGVASVVLEHMYVGNNPYLKKWNFRVQRIHQKADGEVQWYDEKSSLILGDQTTAILEEFEVFDILDSAGNLTGTSAGPFGNGDLIAVEPEVPVGDPLSVVNTLWDLNTNLYLRKVFTTTQFNETLTLVGAVDDGCEIYLDGVLITSVNYKSYLNPYAPDIGLQSFSATLSNIEIGDHTLLINSSDEQSGSTGNYIGVRITRTPRLAESMNPAHIIRECITDPNWGLGMDPENGVDEDSFIAAADALYDEKLFMDIAWRKQSTVDKFIKEIGRHINAEVYFDRISGKANIKLIRDDYIVGNLIVLDESNIVKMSKFAKPGFGDLVNSITINYYNLELGADASITVQDIGLIAEQGSVVDKTFTYSGFSTKELAIGVAKRELRSISAELISCKLVVVSTAAADLNLGDPFVLSWSEYGLSPITMRVTSVNLGTDKNGSITIGCVQDAFSTTEVEDPIEEVSKWRDYQTDPVPVSDFTIFEVPYFELIQTISETTVRSMLSENPNAGYVGMAAKRPLGGLSARLHTNSGGGYQEVGAIDFCPSASLIIDIDESATGFQVNNVDDVDNARIGSWFQVDDELMSIESFANGTTLTVKRGVLDTIPVAHAQGATLLFWDEFAEGDPIEYIQSDVVSTRLATVTSNGTLGIELSPERSVALNSRAARPYPAGNVQLNGEYFPDNVSGDIVVTWSSRNRLLQTSGILLGWTEGNVTPEAGTTYNVRLMQGVSIIDSDDGISVLTTTFTGVATGVYEMEITVIRDSLESYQVFSHQFAFSVIEPESIVSEEAIGTATIANV